MCPQRAWAAVGLHLWRCASYFVIAYHATVATLDVLSRACLSWVEENVAVEPWQRIGVSAICIDPGIAEELR
jgi:hypothetical protein